MDWEGFIPDIYNAEYTSQLKACMQNRVNVVKEFKTAKEGYDKLSQEVLGALEKLVKEL